MKAVTVVGARPQFIKAAPVSKKLRENHEEILVHTGQHYDDFMSDIFFSELDVPLPDYHLGVGSGNHGNQTGKMLGKIEEVLLVEKPDWLLVYGDTNSTLAGALAATKLHIPVLHVEAGLRSRNRRMPEEINRVVTDHVSTILACPTQQAVANLAGEGFNNIAGGNRLWNPEGSGLPAVFSADNPLVVNTGDVMLDALLFFRKAAEKRSTILSSRELCKQGYILATVHRAENTDCRDNLRGILEGLALLDQKVVLPLHPRTVNKINEFNLCHFLSGNIVAMEPVGYLDMLVLAGNASLVVTDSGGLQKEAFILGTPCITLRDETEWVETVEAGGNILAGQGGRHLSKMMDRCPSIRKDLHPYGDGDAAGRIAKLIA